MAKTIEITNTILIKKPIAEVYEFVTTAALWVKWHPATISVRDADHSAKAGETFLEKVRLGLMKGEIRWTVKESHPPERWVIHGVADTPLAKGAEATITYQLSAADGGTRFERRMVYAPKSFLLTLLNWLFVERHNRRESREALERLKRVLEVVAGFDLRG